MSLSVTPINPKPFLSSIIGERICVKLKWGMEYRGIFKSFDAYMNVRLAEAEEWIRGELKGKLGEVFIRCNNVLYIREDKEEKGKKKRGNEENKSEKAKSEKSEKRRRESDNSDSTDN